MKILIVEDEKELGKSIAAYLSSENYFCETAGSVQEALRLTDTCEYDCILLDISLPDGNGLAVLKNLKADKKTDGVIIISANSSLSDKIKGLNLGADDYLAKPFHLSEVSARVAAVIRRRNFNGNSILQHNEIKIDTAAQTVLVNNYKLDLTRKEYDLLLYLLVNKTRVISKNAIAEHLNGSYENGFDNFDFIYAHIKNLKKKLQHAGAADYIKSIYGIGYKFEK